MSVQVCVPCMAVICPRCVSECMCEWANEKHQLYSALLMQTIYHLYVWVCVHECICVRLYVCLYVCLCLCVFVFVCLCVRARAIEREQQERAIEREWRRRELERERERVVKESITLRWRCAGLPHRDGDPPIPPPPPILL